MVLKQALVGAVAIVAALSLNGCGASDSPTDATAAASSGMTTSGSTSATTKVTTSPLSPSSSTTTPESTTSVSAGPVVRTSGSLTLADARETSDWYEGSFEVPKQEGAIKAIASDIGCYGDRSTIEFRFSRQTGTLRVDVAQDQDSDSSSVVLEFTLTADGRSVDVKKIPFDQQAFLEVPLDGVSVVQISVDQADTDSRCPGSTTALLTNVSIA